MNDTLIPPDSIELLGAIVAFAIFGAVLTFAASRKNNEQWQWAKGKYELLILTAAGALAGVFTLSVGGDLGGVVFGAAVLTSGKLIREAMKIGESSHDRYQELRDQGVEPAQAAVLGLQHGLEQGNIEEVRESLAVLLDTAGQRPSRETARERSDELGDAFFEGGAGGAFDDILDDDEDLESVTDIDDAGRASMGSSAESNADEPSVDEGGETRPRVINDGP